MHFVDKGGFAHTRVAPHENELVFARRYVVVAGHQVGDLGGAAVEFFGDAKRGAHVAVGQREARGGLRTVQVRAPDFEIVEQAGSALVAIFCHLLGEAQHDVAEYLRQVGAQGGERRHFTGDVRVYDLQRIISAKGRPTGEHLVKQDPQTVKIGAVIGGAIHAPGLLGREVGQAIRLIELIGRRVLDR